MRIILTAKEVKEALTNYAASKGLNVTGLTLGYITDDDADGTYDTYHDDNGAETTLGKEGNYYLIDNNKIKPINEFNKLDFNLLHEGLYVKNQKFRIDQKIKDVPCRSFTFGFNYM